MLFLSNQGYTPWVEKKEQGTDSHHDGLPHHTAGEQHLGRQMATSIMVTTTLRAVFSQIKKAAKAANIKNSGQQKTITKDMKPISILLAISNSA